MAALKDCTALYDTLVRVRGAGGYHQRCSSQAQVLNEHANPSNDQLGISALRSDRLMRYEPLARAHTIRTTPDGGIDLRLRDRLNGYVVETEMVCQSAGRVCERQLR
jgi:hypothetical protein